MVDFEERPDLWDSHRTARRLGVKDKTLAQWRWAGRGPAFVRVGRAIRYEPETVDAFIESRRANSTSDPGGATSAAVR